MPIQVTCPGCSKSLQVPDSAAGKKGKCPQCGSRVQVPMQAEQHEPNSFLDDLDDAVREGERITKQQQARVQRELQVAEADANLSKRMQSAEATRAAKQSLRRISCDYCGDAYEIELTDEMQQEVCGRCGRSLIIPTLKAYDYDAKGRFQLGIFAALVVAAFVVFVVTAYRSHLAYLETPEEMANQAAYQKARSIADLEVAIASGSTPLRIQHTSPKCIKRGDEGLYLFHYEVYYVGRSDLQRESQYIVIQCQGDETKLVDKGRYVSFP